MNGLFVVLCYPITNWIVFEYIYFLPIISRVVFELTNLIEYMVLTQPKHDPRTRITTLERRHSEVNDK